MQIFSNFFIQPWFLFRGAVFAFVIAVFVFGCDTISSVKPAQDKTFIKLFGGNGSEEGKDLIALPNNEGFVLVGSSTSNGGGDKDVYVVKTNNLGDVEWELREGGDGDDIGNSVILSNDGNSIYVCGEISQDSLSVFGFRDVFVLHIDLNTGALNSSPRTYGQVTRDEFGTDIIELDNGGFFISSTWLNADSSQLYLVETTPSLDTIPLRSRYVGAKGVNNFSASSFESNDQFYPFMCFGTTYRTDEVDSSFWFQSFQYDGISNSFGKWEFYGSSTSRDICFDAIITADKGYALAGVSTEDGISRERIVKISLDQSETQKNTYSNEFNRNIKDCGVFQTLDRGFILTSTIELADPKNDEISLLKLNENLEIEWRKTYGSNENDKGSNILQLEDGSFMLVGTMGFDINPDSQSKMCLMKINQEGELIPVGD